MLSCICVASNVHYFKCDITSPKEIAAVAKEIRAKVGYPTVLINNAGVARGKSILDSNEKDIRFTFDVNTLAHYWIVQEFLPSLVENNHGMVVTVASVASWVTGKQIPPPPRPTVLYTTGRDVHD